MFIFRVKNEIVNRISITSLSNALEKRYIQLTKKLLSAGASANAKLDNNLIAFTYNKKRITLALFPTS